MKRPLASAKGLSLTIRVIAGQQNRVRNSVSALL